MLLKKDACVLLAAGPFLPDPDASAGACVVSLPWQPDLVLQTWAAVPLGEMHKLEYFELDVWESVKSWADK